MNDREINPEKYIAPENWYTYSGDKVKAYEIRILSDVLINVKQMRRFYEKKLSSFQEVMSVKEVINFTGYNRRTVSRWILKGKMRALRLPEKYMIPKCYLVNWMCTEEYNRIDRKSRTHVHMLWEMTKKKIKYGIILHEKNPRLK